jgi:hypothetical protein
MPAAVRSYILRITSRLIAEGKRMVGSAKTGDPIRALLADDHTMFRQGLAAVLAGPSSARARARKLDLPARFRGFLPSFRELMSPEARFPRTRLAGNP